MPSTPGDSSATIMKVSPTNRRIETHIVIDATPDEVWSVLTDWDNLSNWSSSFVGFEGELEEGAEVTVTFKVLGVKMRLKRTLVNVVDGTEFGWSGKFALGMVDRHRYRVESEGPHLVRFVQSDKVMGGSSRIFGAVTARLLTDMYVEFNQQLHSEVQRRAETGET